MSYIASSSLASSDTLKCGEHGEYGDQKKRTGKGKYHRDHIPSKAALKLRAQVLNLGRELSDAQATAIENQAMSVVIPAGAHRNISPTYGGRNTATVIRDDADNLAGAARDDTGAMIGNIKNYDPQCAEAYKAAANRINAMTNDDYDAFLENILDNPAYA